MKKLSIGPRVTLWYLLIFLFAEVIFGVGMFAILRSDLLDIADEAVEGQAADLQRFLDARKNEPAAQLQAEISEDYRIESSEDFLQISDAAGNIIYRSRFFAEHPLPQVAVEDLDRPLYQNRKLGHDSFRLISEQMEVGGRVFIVRIGHSTEEEIETLDAFRNCLFWYAPVLLLVASAGGYWVSRRALAPVDALTKAARAISGRNLSSRLEPLHTGDELQRLSDTLNEMLARIEAAFLRITEFTADASHELRTPIALIHTEAELALRRSRTDHEYQEALRHILLEATRSASLIEELLTLARADSGREVLQIQSVDFLPALQEAAAKWKRVAALRNLQFVEHLPLEGLPVVGDENALCRVVDILLDNAFKYTPAPGKVTFRASQRGAHIEITVEDSGIGIPAGDHARIFERFYRVDKARSRELGGAGLGLAIAQWIVQLHKGSISVESVVGRGSTFRIEIPAAYSNAESDVVLPAVQAKP